MRLRTAPVFLAFVAMGFADAAGPFVSLAKNELQLSYITWTALLNRQTVKHAEMYA